MVLNEKGKRVGVSVAYPPANLYHILFELFKNSMRATVETHHEALKLPKIEVLLAKGEHDVSIRISDQVINPSISALLPKRNLHRVEGLYIVVISEKHTGIYMYMEPAQGGGIPRHITDQTFHYLVSTAPRPSFDNPSKAPLAGYGGILFLLGKS